MHLSGTVLAAALLLGAAAGPAARGAGLEPLRITSGSMAPAVERGDWVLATRARQRPRPGEIVVFRHPPGSSRLAIKRVSSVRGGAVFLLGDNRDASIDSRHFGAVPARELVGRVELVAPGGLLWALVLVPAAVVAYAVNALRCAVTSSRSGSKRRA